MLRRLLLLVWVFTAAIVVGQISSALGSSGGIAGHSGNPGIGGGSSCATCHTGGVAPAVSLSGPTVVDAGTTARYTLTVSGGQAAGGGFGLSADSGTLAAVSGDASVVNGELVQTSTKPVDAGGAVSWTFDWTAPGQAGTATFFAAGNSVNNDGGVGGDGVTTTSLVVTIAAPVNQDPIAVIAGPIAGVPLQGVVFDGTGSSDPDGSIVSYRWDFGDGSASVDFGVASAQLQHSYPVAGSYTVTLTVTDDQGATTTTSTTATIGDGEPPPPPTLPPTTTTTTTTTTPAATTTTAAAPAVADGWAVFGRYCAGCHGSSGGGGSGPSLIDSTGSRRAFVSAVADGIGTMPGFGGVLSSAEMDAVVAVSLGMRQSAGSPTTTTTLPADASGGVLYASACASCHGSAGEGGIGPALDDAPRNAAVVAAVTADGIGTMPGFADQLTPAQIQRVAAYAAGLAGEPAETEDAEDADAGDPDPAAVLYATNCAGCHGAAGEGATAGDLLRSFGSDELFELIATGPSTMPAFDEILTGEEITMLVEHVQGFTAEDVATVVSGAIERREPVVASQRSVEVDAMLAALPGPDQADVRSGLPIGWLVLLIALALVVGVAWVRRPAVVHEGAATHGGSQK